MGQGKGNGTRRPADVSWSKFSRENTGRMGGKEGTSVPRGLREQGRGLALTLQATTRQGKVSLVCREQEAAGRQMWS